MKNRLFLSIVTALIVIFSWGVVSESTLFDISSDIVRLHIIANSNSQDDQKLKLEVRDRLLNENFENIKYDLNKIKEVCEEEISEKGYDYKVTANYGQFYFPNKTYENITLPAGDYNAIKIIIGEGKGENWWCVMYPPLCYSTGTNGGLSEEKLNLLKNSMKTDNYELIENGEIKIKPALKIVEWWQEIRHGF
ncbi:MAG: stage II sporulation protein R [Ruminococcaceae bacterium]|nr:stage II sporulation protein R [Oscillospiraceae bacterium]